MRKNLIIGVTGGIAAGKSFVAGEFRNLGAAIVDADAISREILNSPLVVRRILNRFGSGIVTGTGGIDRRKLGKIVFSDGKKLKFLEKITHPAIIKRIKYEAAAKSSKNITVLDIPLLFEKKLEKTADFTILAYLPEKIQIERIVKRGGLSKSEAIQRISAQMPLALKVKMANIALDNTQTKKEVRKQVTKLWKFFANAPRRRRGITGRSPCPY